MRLSDGTTEGRSSGPPPPTGERLSAVLLDSLGTLLALEPPGPRLRAELAARDIAVSEEEAESAFRAEIAHYLGHHLEGRDPASLERLRDGCAQVLLDALALPRSSFEPAREAMLAALRFSPYPDAVSALRALREAGKALVVVSNWDCSLAGALAEAGLLELVDRVVTSAEVGAAKPDAAPFREGLAVAGCDTGAAVHVGDSIERDVQGARAAGIAAVLVQRGPAGGRALEVSGPVVRTLEEACALLLGAP